jgi:hypothetical protein
VADFIVVRAGRVKDGHERHEHRRSSAKSLELDLEDQTLTTTFRQPFHILAVTNTAWPRQKAAGDNSSDLRAI